MNTTQDVQTRWGVLRDRISQRWEELTRGELDSIGADFDALVTMIQERTGEAREEVEKTLRQFDETASSLFERAAATAQSYAAYATDAARDGAQQAGQMLHTQHEEAKALVRKRPTESFALAFGVGLAAGLLLSFSRSR